MVDGGEGNFLHQCLRMVSSRGAGGSTGNRGWKGKILWQN